MADVILDNVSKHFGDHVAVRDLSLTIKQGEFIVLLGPTGAGKTTTLRLIAGLERPDAGNISIGGIDATKLPPAAMCAASCARTAASVAFSFAITAAVCASVVAPPPAAAIFFPACW